MTYLRALIAAHFCSDSLIPRIWTTWTGSNPPNEQPKAANNQHGQPDKQCCRIRLTQLFPNHPKHKTMICNKRSAPTARDEWRRATGGQSVARVR
jgi:hypothetical protein